MQLNLSPKFVKSLSSNISFYTLLAYNFSFLDSVFDIIDIDIWYIRADKDHTYFYQKIVNSPERWYNTKEFKNLSKYEYVGMTNEGEFDFFIFKKRDQ